MLTHLIFSGVGSVPAWGPQTAASGGHISQLLRRSHTILEIESLHLVLGLLASPDAQNHLNWLLSAAPLRAPRGWLTSPSEGDASPLPEETHFGRLYP